jgi:hypothetical protein
VSIKGGNVAITATDNDISEVFGVESCALGAGLMDRLINAVANSVPGSADIDAPAMTAALNAVAELEPRNAAEAMIASMAVAANHLGLSLCAVGMKPVGNRLGFAQTALNAMRTSAQLLGDLDKRRNGPVTTQRIDVRYLDARGGQVAIGPTVTGGGGTGGEEEQ